ncbi:MAG: ABC transporter permease subunit [Lewinella sp.]|nr:ABC transporter permease subunit [Lewinella sp.]
MSLLDQRSRFTSQQKIALLLGGFVITLLVWWGLAEALSRQRPLVDIETRLPSTIVQDSSSEFHLNRDSLLLIDSLKLANATEFEKIYPLLPPPHLVVKAFPSLWKEDALIKNTWISIWRNLQGYFWAVFVALLLGFPIGLWPALRAMFGTQVDALRYLPLTALTGLFILWFGIGDSMKVAFLAFGILVYLLPVVVQRIGEVEDVFLKTTFTLGASNWQMIRTVYFPAVLSKLIDDIRVLTAISWTYIIIAELLNRDGGVGAMLFINGRQGNVDKVFGWLIVIILVGFLQDRLFIYLDRRLFPHKYYKTVFGGIKEVEYGFLVAAGTVMTYLLLGMFFPALTANLGNIVLILVITGIVMALYGEVKFQRSFQA